MRMSDVMSHMDLAVYPILGMMLFLSVFVGVVLRRKLLIGSFQLIRACQDCNAQHCVGIGICHCETSLCFPFRFSAA